MRCCAARTQEPVHPRTGARRAGAGRSSPRRSLPLPKGAAPWACWPPRAGWDRDPDQTVPPETVPPEKESRVFDNLKNLKDKAEELAEAHGDTISDGLEKAGDIVDDKTDGKY